jgi:hypothetical protein
MSKKHNEGDYTFLSIKVESYEAAVGVSVNLNLRTSVPHWYSDEDPVFTPEMRLEVMGTCISPRERAGDNYEIVIYGERAEREQPKLKDIHVRDGHEVPVYRSYRGQQIPVYKPPPGIAVLKKQRGRPEWSLAVWVLPQVSSDMLTLLTAPRPLWVHIHERRVERQRWMLGLTLQTRDPANE